MNILITKFILPDLQTHKAGSKAKRNAMFKNFDTTKLKIKDEQFFKLDFVVKFL